MRQTPMAKIHIARQTNWIIVHIIEKKKCGKMVPYYKTKTKKSITELYW